MGMLTPDHCILEECHFLFDFIGTNSYEFALSLRKLNLEVLNRVEMVTTLRILNIEPKAFHLRR